MRRRTAVAGVVVLAVVGGGAYVTNRLARGGEVTEVGVDRAVERYREQLAAGSSTVAITEPVTVTVVESTDTTETTDTTDTAPGAPSTVTPGTATPAPVTTAAAPVAALPEPGVYAYSTVGFDAVDALNGARHDYPDVTTITVTPHGCGVRVRWDVAVERWDSWDWCLAGAGSARPGIELVGWTGFHQFFGVAGEQAYMCTGDPRPLDAEPGTAWEVVCRSGDTDTSTFRGVVVERTSLQVAGVDVATLHVRYDVEVVGGSNGTQSIEGWYRIADGLPVREVTSTVTQQETPIGAANFEEQVTIELLDTTPLA